MIDDVIIEPMIKDDLDKLTDSLNRIADKLGFTDYDAMQEFKYNAVEGLQRFGGSFARALGYALLQADTFNSAKIMAIFKEECTRHAGLYLKYLEKEQK